MTGFSNADGSSLRRVRPTVLLGAPLTAFAIVAGWPWFLVVPIAAGATAGSIAFRRSTHPALREVEAAPALVGLILIAARALPSPLAELAGGAAGVAVLAWLADAPGRTPGGLGRAGGILAVATLALALAFGAGLILPSNAAPVGVAAALLAFAVVVLAIVFGIPRFWRPDPPATA